MNQSAPLRLALVGLASLTAAGPLSAAVVYQASYTGSDTLPFFANTLRYGDQITLAGTERVLTEFSFAYYSDYSAPRAMVFALYANDGVGGAPGTLLYSDIYDLIRSVSGVDVTIPFIPDFEDLLPDTFTWTVQFNGSGTAGLLIADPPTIGFSRDEFWELRGSVWSLQKVGGGHSSNFEAKVTAIAVPEPLPLSLAALGLAAAAVGMRSGRTARR